MIGERSGVCICGSVDDRGGETPAEMVTEHHEGLGFFVRTRKRINEFGVFILVLAVQHEMEYLGRENTVL
jgi:hypothetical protein